MKFLSDYTEKAQSEALKKAGAFFAFSNKQFDEERKEGVKYVSLGMGLICPENTAKQLIEDFDDLIKKGIEQDIKENGKTNIIKRELANHEAYYTGDIADTIDTLKGYNITKEEIKKVFTTEKEIKLNFN